MAKNFLEAPPIATPFVEDNAVTRAWVAYLDNLGQNITDLLTEVETKIGQVVLGDLSVSGNLDVEGDISGEIIYIGTDYRFRKLTSPLRFVLERKSGDAWTVMFTVAENGDMTLVNDLVVTNDASIGGDLDVTGDVAGATATIAGAATIGGTLEVADDLSVLGPEDTDAILNLFADEGDDNADKWRIRISKTANIAYFETFASGAWVAKWIVDAAGDFTVANDVVLPADGDRIYFGGGKDAAVYYDGTNLNVNSSLVAPSDIVIICGAAKTLKLETAVWDDLRVPVQSTKLNPTKSEPNFENFADGLFAYAFDTSNADDESLHFIAQLPHAYKQGTEIRAHVHWMPSNTNAGNVRWALEYAWFNINATYPNSTVEVTTEAADGTALKHQVHDLAEVAGSGKIISSILICALTRRSNSDAADTFTGIAYAMEIDFHFQIDTMGSRQEFVK